MALCPRRLGVCHGGRGRCNPIDRLGALDHRMAADPRHHTAPERGGLARRTREVSPDSAIRAAQQGHVDGRVQGHLLVGVGAPLPGPDRRLRLSLAVALFLGAGRAAQGSVAAPACHFCARWPARRAWLVHGPERSGRPGGCQSVPPGRASHTCLGDFRRDLVDGAWPLPTN